MYNTILFDADGTLLDFKASEKLGLETVFKDKNIEFSEAMRQYYLELNDKLWKDFELGKCRKEDIMEVRFPLLLDHFHIQEDAHALERAYRQQLKKGSHSISGALSLCHQLQEEFSLYIVSNGVADTQYQRLHDSGLDVYFKGIFVSEEIGFQKPQELYFDYVFNKIKVEKEEVLLIGDSLSSDILGANLYGIDSCWFNPEHHSNHSESKPTYEIDRLEQVWNLL